MTLSSDTIILGEPLWVDVRVTNRSAMPISVDMGNTCMGGRPLEVEVPRAERRADRQKRCGVGPDGGGCVTAGPQNLVPGGTLGKRYVFDGDFRITHGGDYRVRLSKLVRYGPAVTLLAPLSNAASQTSVVETTLHVEPADPEKLLTLERRLAALIPATASPMQFPPHADIETVRRIVSEHRDLANAALEGRIAVVDGLAAYPAAGMEPFFASRLDDNRVDYDAYQATTALYNLNTNVARAALVDVIVGSPNPNAPLAVRYLGLMGDPSYLPLLERLVTNPDPTMRQQAVLALGFLGGESELPRLEFLAQKGATEADRNSAIMAIGNTGTLRAVPFLIALFGAPNPSPLPGYSLFLLTHHQLSSSEYATPRDEKVAWQMWWAQNRATAHAYHPWEHCPEPTTK